MSWFFIDRQLMATTFANITAIASETGSLSGSGAYASIIFL